MNKKGFTLVELLAVMVILIIVILIALTRVRKTVDKSADQAIVANAGVVIKAVNGAASNVNILQSTALKDGVIPTSSLTEYGVNITGTKPDNGYVWMKNFEVNEACMEYDGYKVNYSNGNFGKPSKGHCMVPNLSQVYAYTGGVQTFNVTVDGTYKLEVWGAQGGKVNDSYHGGYGAYAVGEAYFTAGTTLYVNVGGQGESGCVSADCASGYNGGGKGMYYSADSNNTVAAGGGATSISSTSQSIDSLTDGSSLYIVAGGGGGAYYHTNGVGYSENGGNAGGYTGVSGKAVAYTSTTGGGGGLTGGGAAGYRGGAGSFGKGGVGSAGSSGGGGGFYGGGASAHSGSGGGSSFIGNYKIDKGNMYCYECTESTIKYFKTTSIGCAENNPTPECAKKGDGYAKISFISKQDTTNSSDKLYLYSFGDEFKEVTGGWTGGNDQSRGRNEKGQTYMRIYYSSSGQSGSYFKTNNNIDTTGYTKLNVVYQIASAASATSEWSCLRTTGVTEWGSISAYMAPGIYVASVPLIENLNSAKAEFWNYDSDIRIMQVWLSKD